ncbi:MAG: hypothetical protein INR66_26565 [Gordonia polyisoprenivorans]|nr:hypothetical protein [Gordonia polyisoprenivorans]
MRAPSVPALRPAIEDLRESIAAIETRIETGTAGGVYMRSAALIDDVLRATSVADDPWLVAALRDLTMLDGALARLAAALDMQVRDHDTTDLVEPVPADR